MGRTSKPCPGCGEVEKHREADSVCWKCAGYIEKGKAVEGREKRRKAFDDYNLPEDDNYPLHFPDNEGDTSEVIYRIRRAVNAALLALAEPALGEDSYGGDVDHYLPEYADHRWWKRVRMSKQTAQTVRDLTKVMQRASLVLEAILECGRKLADSLPDDMLAEDESNWTPEQIATADALANDASAQAFATLSEYIQTEIYPGDDGDDQWHADIRPLRNMNAMMPGDAKARGVKITGADITGGVAGSKKGH